MEAACCGTNKIKPLELLRNERTIQNYKGGLNSIKFKSLTTLIDSARSHGLDGIGEDLQPKVVGSNPSPGYYLECERSRLSH